MSKGRKKADLRGLRAELTTEEGHLLLLAVSADRDEHPIAHAIIGAEYVEHELDLLLYKKLRLKDKKTWSSLTGEIGPLSTFHRKITLGFALRFYDDRIRHDLTLVKNIRNAFAHNRKLITFNHELILSELKTAKLVSKAFKSWANTKKDDADPRLLYTLICMRLALRLAKKRHGKRARRIPKGGFLASLLSQTPHPQAPQKASAPSFLQRLAADPNPQARPPRMGDILGYTPPKAGDS